MDEESIEGTTHTFPINTHFQPYLRLWGSQFSCKSWVSILALAADGVQGEKEHSAQSLIWHCWLQNCSVLQDKDQKPQTPKTLVCVSSTCRIILCDLSVHFTCWKFLGDSMVMNVAGVNTPVSPQDSGQLVHAWKLSHHRGTWGNEFCWNNSRHIIDIEHCNLWVCSGFTSYRITQTHRIWQVRRDPQGSLRQSFSPAQNHPQIILKHNGKKPLIIKITLLAEELKSQGGGRFLHEREMETVF